MRQELEQRPLKQGRFVSGVKVFFAVSRPQSGRVPSGIQDHATAIINFIGLASIELYQDTLAKAYSPA